MPIKIPSGLPARAILDSERIFALEKPEAERQRVRPLKLVILNLMPKKIETETQLLRLISKSPLQVEIDFMKTSTHESTHVSADHLVKFYDALSQSVTTTTTDSWSPARPWSIWRSSRWTIGTSSRRS